jgi:hypothetical protein
MRGREEKKAPMENPVKRRPLGRSRVDNSVIL